ncbi:hypothetical protein NXY11_24965 [Parabacteroides faecis]|uniref:hypothetical protein n=1 Tax=Parabacteroides faecis TaxID=1217282 RepID=UPI0021640DF3|nr:hypothetical protein [Parabacteroides faecis]UVQ46352.1 hypothetical protein NXY11_24965 [Parabacteroides faecis]
MKRKFISFLLVLPLFAAITVSCDDGKIYNEGNGPVKREGSTIKLTAHISKNSTWPSGYSLVFAGFAPNDEYAQTAKGLGIENDGSVNMVLSGISNEVNQLEICIINKLRKRIVTFYKMDFTEQADTIMMDAGVIDASIFNSIQSNIFNAYCTNCHGAGNSAAGDLYLTEDKSYAALINVKAVSSEEGKMLVKPNDVENSYMLDVLTEGASPHYHNDILSAQMDKLSLLKSWIEEGAQK